MFETQKDTPGKVPCCWQPAYLSEMQFKVIIYQLFSQHFYRSRKKVVVRSLSMGGLLNDYENFVTL